MFPGTKCIDYELVKSAISYLDSLKGNMRAQGAAWAAVVTWAHDAARQGGPPHVRDLPEHARGAAARVRHIANALAARLPDPLQTGDAAVVYKAAWFAMHFRGYHAWMQQRSASRRWAPGDGSEWGILSSAATTTDAARVLRFLCNGLPGGSRWRPREQRPPRTCSSCADEGVVIAQEAPTRLQSGRIAPGLGWCRGCAGPWTDGQTWACLPDDSLPPQLRPSAARLREERPGLLHFSGAPSCYGACPLCGSGEAGAEHLWVGCPVTETVWDEFGDGTMPWAHALRTGNVAHGFTAHILSQVVFLHSALVGRAALTASESVRRIRAAIRCAVNSDDPASDADCQEDHGTCPTSGPADYAV